MADALPAGGQAGTAVYGINDRQYPVVMAGGHRFMETPGAGHGIACAIP